MTMYQVRTFEDIYRTVLEELKVPATDTTTLNRIKRDINMEYFKLIARENWKFARMPRDITFKKYYNTGTVAVTQESRTLTFSTAITESKKGHYFFAEGYNEIYRISTHVAGTSVAQLESDYTGNTNSSVSFKVFTNEIPLPSNMLDVYNAAIDFRQGVLDALDDQSFEELFRQAPYLETRPGYFTVTDFIDADEYDSISGLPAMVSRYSSGTIRSIVFASDVSDYIEAGDEINISSSDNESYNGEAIVESVDTVTVKYLLTEELTEGATSDSNLTLEIKNSENLYRSQLKLRVYPALYDKDVTIHINGTRRPKPLEQDADEPMVPMEYRSILVYGALSKAWRRHRNPEESANNYALYKEAFKTLRGKYGPGKDTGKFKVNSLYLAGKRKSRRWNGYWSS